MTQLKDYETKEETIEIPLYKYESLIRSSEKLATVERILKTNKDTNSVLSDVLNAIIGTHDYWQFTTKEFKESKGQQ